MNYKFSNQAVGAVMMALQKSLMEQTDIVPVLRGFSVQIDDVGELVVVNPPVVKSDGGHNQPDAKRSKVVTS